jgi:hypothetical protein
MDRAFPLRQGRRPRPREGWLGMNIHVYEYLFDLNEHYQKMIAVLEQLAEIYPNLKGEEFRLHRSRLRELQASTNIGLLETLLWDEIQQYEEVRKERLTLEQKNPEEAELDNILSQWMEQPDRSEQTED